MHSPSVSTARVWPCPLHRGLRSGALAAALLLACDAYAEDAATDQATERDAVSVTAARVHANAPRTDALRVQFAL
jgi:iron complex outermembrane recepter protein